MYKVVKCINDSPVSVVRYVAPANSDGPTRTLHHELILPCGFLAPATKVELIWLKQKEGIAKFDQSPNPEEEDQLKHPY